jgi:hypothetical protein
MNIVKKPNFFIVGAPKCGTTALYHYLKQHPDIYFAPKEIHHFGSDLTFRENKQPLTDDQYLQCFASATSESRLGDASVWYLYSTNAAREIKKFSPDARIIIMIRNPVDMLYSNYYQNRWNGDEPLETFQMALDAEADRKAGNNLPNTTAPGPIEALYYSETALFTNQIKRYLDVFGREAVHIIVYDDFATDVNSEFRSVLHFLGVNESFEPDFTVVNANKAIANQFLWKLMKYPPPWLRKLWKIMLPPGLRGMILRKTGKTNKKVIARPAIEPATREYLISRLSQEISNLSELLQRDLSSWFR